MGKNPRGNAIYMAGMTFGAGFGILLMGIYANMYSGSSILLTGIIVGLLLIGISFVWRSRANKSK